MSKIQPWYLLLPFVILLIGCATRKPLSYNKTRTIKVDSSLHSAYQYGNNSPEVPMDSLIYQLLLARKNGEACARRLAYGISDLELLRLTQNGEDFQYYQYEQVRAFATEDTIQIEFNLGPIAGGKVLYFIGKPLEIKLYGQEYQTKLTHTSDALPAIVIKEGKVISRGTFPQSDFVYSKLEFNQSSYQLGDTIKGYFYARSVLNHPKAQSPEKEIIKGNFRVIVEKRDPTCR